MGDNVAVEEPGVAPYGVASSTKPKVLGVDPPLLSVSFGNSLHGFTNHHRENAQRSGARLQKIFV